MMMDTVNACAQLQNLKKGKKLQVKPQELVVRAVQYHIYKYDIGRP